MDTFAPDIGENYWTRSESMMTSQHLTDVNLDLMRPSDRTASCPYKGDSNFFSAQIGDRLVEDIAWTYVLPRPESTPIAGLVSFYNEVVDIEIDGEPNPRPVSHFA